MFEENVGRYDQIARITAGLVLLGFAGFCPWAAEIGAWATVPSGIIGAVLLATGITRRCPAYRALG
jgi:hypothetical protein